MTPEQRDAATQVRLRLRDDFRYYCQKALKIRTKKAEIVSLTLNHAQELLLDAIEKQKAETGRVRIVILKARQQGLSTAVGARLYQRVSQASAKKAIVVTHKADSTTALFNMTKRYHENVPPILRPSTSYSSRKELVFDKLDSSYMVATAGGDSIARGETLTHAHLSELAFWKEGVAMENLNGLLQSIPDADDTEIYIESTANGVTGPFYDFWRGAVEGTNGYLPVFIPWFLDPDYRKTAPADFVPTPEEADLIVRYGVDHDQLYWRRTKIHQSGKDLFKQEYPAEPSEAFLTTGRPVFDPEQLTLRDAELRTKDTTPERLSLVLGKWEPYPAGELVIYRPVVPGMNYTIGADVAMGVRNGDYSVAQVLDERKRQCAVWSGHVHPDYYADILFALGKLFNEAKIAVEANNHGLLTVNLLYKHLNYPNVYTNTREEQISDVETPDLGFITSAKTKPLIIDDLRASLRKGELELNDRPTIAEMLTFVVKESGKVEAEDGKHDDRVMSLAIANHVHDGVWEPVPVTDDFFFEAI